jgi:hypothetical protein
MTDNRFYVIYAPHQPIAPLARDGPVQERKGDRRASRVLEALVVWPDRAPPVIEVDEKASILPVDAARKEWLQHMTPQGVSGLLSVDALTAALSHGRRGRRASGRRVIARMRGVMTVRSCQSPREGSNWSPGAGCTRRSTTDCDVTKHPYEGSVKGGPTLG